MGVHVEGGHFTMGGEGGELGDWGLLAASGIMSANAQGGFVLIL